LVWASVLGTAAGASDVQPGETVELIGVGPLQAPWYGNEWAAETELQTFLIVDDSGVVLYAGRLVAQAVIVPPLEHPLVWYTIRSLGSEAPSTVATVTVEGLAGRTLFAEFRSDQGGGATPLCVERTVDGDALRIDYGAGVGGLISSPVYVYSTGSGLARGRVTLSTAGGETVVLENVLIPGAPLASCEGDANGDGVINFTDLNGVLTNFGESCP
jgi:hypothetical protein